MGSKYDNRNIDLDDIKERYCKFENLKTIAISHDVTEFFIVTRAKMYNWQHDTEFLKELYLAGISIKTMAMELGASQNVISKIIKKNKWSRDCKDKSRSFCNRTIDLQELDKALSQKNVDPKLRAMVMMCG